MAEVTVGYGLTVGRTFASQLERDFFFENPHDHCCNGLQGWRLICFFHRSRGLLEQ